MYKIDDNIHTFAEALKQKSTLVCASGGNFYFESLFVSWVRRSLGFEERRLINLSRSLRNSLEGLEKIAVRFMDEKGNQASQVVEYQLYISVGDAILGQLDSLRSEKGIKERDALRRDVVALRYRLEGINGGYNPSVPSKELHDALIDVSQTWKISQSVFHGNHLSYSDILILQDACRYPEFVRIILSNTDFLEEFLTWALRDKIAIRPFIEYPSLQKRITASGLNGRIGRMGGDFLKVQKIRNEANATGILDKVVTLPFEGRDTSIIDDQRFVLFRGNYALSIAEVFDLFKNKAYRPGNLEFMVDGIINWNEHFWGWWDADKKEYHVVDLEQDEWWNQLPLVEVLSLKEARQKFGSHLDGRQWNFAIISTRLTTTLDYENTHAYTSLAIPVGDGRYAVYPFGKYAFEFPPTFLEAVMNIAETTEATVAYPDENIYYSHRQRTRFSFALTEEQGKTYMDSIKRDMLLSRGGNFVYQMASDNCAKWTQEKVEEVIGVHRAPNIFKLPFLESEPHGFMSKVFVFVKSLPKKWQIPFTTYAQLPLGAYKGKWISENGKRVWKSLTHHQYWKDLISYHPAMLHKQQEQGVIGKYLAVGVVLSAKIVCKSYYTLQFEISQLGKYAVSSIRRGINALLEFTRKIRNGRFTTEANPYKETPRGGLGTFSIDLKRVVYDRKHLYNAGILFALTKGLPFFHEKEDSLGFVRNSGWLCDEQTSRKMWRWNDG